jgi:hypothetical protein
MATRLRDIENLPPPPSPTASGIERLTWESKLYDALRRMWSIIISIRGGALVYSSLENSTISGVSSEENFTVSYEAPVSTWEEGCVVRIQAGGVLSSTGEPTLTLKLKAGDTTLLSGGSITVLPGMGEGVDDASWWYQGTLTCRETGSSGVIMANGEGFVAAGGQATGLSNSSVLSLDLSQAQTLRMSAQWGTASGSNSITIQTFTVERMAPPE